MRTPSKTTLSIQQKSFFNLYKRGFQWIVVIITIFLIPGAFAGAITVTPAPGMCPVKDGFTCYNYSFSSTSFSFYDDNCGRGQPCLMRLELAITNRTGGLTAGTMSRDCPPYGYGEGWYELAPLSNISSCFSYTYPNKLNPTPLTGYVNIPDTNPLRKYICLVANWDTWGPDSGDSNFHGGTCIPESATELPPPEPTTSCTINGGQPLDVFFNDIDRTQIGTQPGVYGVTTKNVNVNCTGPAGSQLTASAALNFTPVAGSGAAHISTSNPGLGVVTKLEGNVMTNTTGTPVNLIIGSNQLQMEFTPVRLDTTPIESVATGPFSASASLILTWQ